MKGIVFTQFFDMVEQKFGYDMVDTLITENKLSTDGAYTAVGTYEFAEMVTLLTSLSKHTNLSLEKLLYEFGLFFFDVLEKNYSHFMKRADNAFSFLESIENHIHVEVRKLYPKAELPTFETNLVTAQKLEMTYISERKMAPFAEALIKKSLIYFKEDCSVTKETVSEDGKVVKFLINKN